MKAVHNAQLSTYPSGLDVLVLPSRGSIAPASLLSGGDLDGDTAMVLFCPDIVNAFKSASPQESTHVDIEPYFTTDTLETKSLRDELYLHNRNGEEVANQYLKRHLLESLRHTQFVGIYGRLHENAVYKKGFASDEAIILAHVLVQSISPRLLSLPVTSFNTCMDSAKSGRRIKPEVFERHKKQFHFGSRPAYVPVGPDSAGPVGRDSSLGHHIIDAIVGEAEKMQASYSRRWKDIIERDLSPADKDEDLRQPWNSLLQRCSPTQLPYLTYEQLDRDMLKIVQHVRQCRSQYKNITSGYWATKSAERLGFKTPSKRRGSSRYQDGRSFQEILSSFAAGPELEYLHHDPGELARIKASYAYYMEWPFEEVVGSGGLNNPSDFAYDMAFVELCKIKADAIERKRGSAGPIATIRSFAYASVLKSRVVDSLSSMHWK
jgi:RNA-dependent RNA polymerase